ncbi:MAG: PQQ-binding-like beta-propeller repeat protein, partial [Planctomycetota bacterium]|nr:PQQ-binding-like beta-propeller repeat protein [Planctomycetota bacterium]
RGRYESWSLGPWAIRRIEWQGRQLVLSGPRYIVCYDGSTMALRWHHAAPGASDAPGELDPPAEDGEASPVPVWRPMASGSPCPSASDGRVVYALLARGQGWCDLTALDAPTGREIWTTQGRPEWDAMRVLGEPTAGIGVVYVVAMEQDLQGTCKVYVVCLAADDARTLWKRRLLTTTLQGARMETANYACGVALHQGSLYVSTNMGVLARCDARTGAVEWLRTYYVGGSESPRLNMRREGSVPLVVGRQAFFAPRDHSGVIALDRETGQLDWESPLVPSDQILGLSGRALVVRDADELAALDIATGEEIWSRPVESDADAPGVIAGASILITSGDEILRLSAPTGQAVETAPAPRAGGAEHIMLPSGALVEVREEPLLERTLAPEAAGAPGQSGPAFAKRWTLPCRDPFLVAPPASQPAGEFAGVLSEARFYCLGLRPVCRLAWQMAFRQPPDSAGFHGRLVVFAVGTELLAVDKETGALRWRRTLPFAPDLIAGDDRVILAGRSSDAAPVMAVSPETGAVVWYRWFGQEPRFTGRRLRWISLTGEAAAPVVRLYWGAALFGREGARPAEVLVDSASGTIRDVHLFLPAEPIWPSRISFGDDTRTRTAVDMAIPWPYRGPFRPDAVAYIGRELVGRFALRETGAVLAGGCTPPAESSVEATRRWAGLLATPAGCYVKRLGQLAFFDTQANREVLFNLPRTADRRMPFAIGDFREEAGEKLSVVSVAPGRPYEAGLAEGGPDNRVGKGQLEMMNLLTSDYTKTGLHDDAGNGEVTLTYYALGAQSQVFVTTRGLPEAGANLTATLLNGVTGEYYRGQKIKLTGLASLGWAKYDVFIYGGGSKGSSFDTPALRTTFVRDGNYVKYEGKSGDSFEAEFGWGWSAVQVVDASGRPGPRRSLGVRWTGPGILLGPDDKVGAEVAAGNWYNILTDHPRRQFFVLSGGCLTVAGKRVCGFVDVFGAFGVGAGVSVICWVFVSIVKVESVTLPAGEGPLRATAYDCQAKLLDEALLVTDSNGLYVFRSPAGSPKP